MSTPSPTLSGAKRKHTDLKELEQPTAKRQAAPESTIYDLDPEALAASEELFKTKAEERARVEAEYEQARAEWAKRLLALALHLFREQQQDSTENDKELWKTFSENELRKAEQAYDKDVRKIHNRDDVVRALIHVNYFRNIENKAMWEHLVTEDPAVHNDQIAGVALAVHRTAPLVKRAKKLLQ